jgi:hypothetical protein
LRETPAFYKSKNIFLRKVVSVRLGRKKSASVIGIRRQNFDNLLNIQVTCICTGSEESEGSERANKISLSGDEIHVSTIEDGCLDSRHEGMAERDEGQPTEANPEKREANLDEEVPKEEAAVKSSRALKKLRWDPHLAAGRRQKPNKRSRGNCGSQNKLAGS